MAPFGPPQKIEKGGSSRMRQNAAGVSQPSRDIQTPHPFAQASPRVFFNILSTLLPSRIIRNSLKTNDGGTFYPSQIPRVLFSGKRATDPLAHPIRGNHFA